MWIRLLLFFFFVYNISFAQKNKNKDSSIIEIAPIFIGGTQGLMNFIGDNFKYPESLKNVNCKGKIVVTFVVDSVGIATADLVNTSKIIFKKPRPDETQKLKIINDINNEVIRIFTKMPIWTPATQNGIPVKTYYNLPIRIN